MSTYFEKSQHPDRKGEGGVNPYGQPDSKKTVFYDSPKSQLEEEKKLRCLPGIKLLGANLSPAVKESAFDNLVAIRGR